jgi:hypothetical protein
MIPGAGVRAEPSRRAAPRTRSREDEFIRALETAGHRIKDPVAKLRYIRGSLARYQAVREFIDAVPFAPLRFALYRWVSFEGLRHMLTPRSMGGPVPLVEGTRRLLAVTRAASVAAAVAVVLALAAAAYRPARQASAGAEAVPVLAASLPLPSVAEALPPVPPGVKPTAIWLVEKGDGWEQYSNGLRVDSTYAVGGDPRHYRVFDEKDGLKGPVETKPVGILFHTSESDVWPLEAANNERLRESSHGLLRYVHRLRLYNYVVDRFGRVFRVVEEEAKANHAGNAVWARDGDVYLSLNNAFLGICFETRWDGGRALPITAAQLAAGRSLTDYLRQRWAIAPEMCVTHGLTSVNPKKHLIGHHMDWARGFPFEAFGLPNQYARSAASVALFGFGYDGDFLKVLGEPWAGVRSAERALAEEAARRGRSVEEIRRERQSLYDRWHEEQTREEETATQSGPAQLTEQAQTARVANLAPAKRAGNRQRAASEAEFTSAKRAGGLEGAAQHPPAH